MTNRAPSPGAPSIDCALSLQRAKASKPWDQTGRRRPTPAHPSATPLANGHPPRTRTAPPVEPVPPAPAAPIPATSVRHVATGLTPGLTQAPAPNQPRVAGKSPSNALAVTTRHWPNPIPSRTSLHAHSHRPRGSSPARHCARSSKKSVESTPTVAALHSGPPRPARPIFQRHARQGHRCPATPPGGSGQQPEADHATDGHAPRSEGWLGLVLVSRATCPGPKRPGGCLSRTHPISGHPCHPASPTCR